MKGENESESAESNILREILEENGREMTMTEMEDAWKQRLQVAIRGLRFTGELEHEDQVAEKVERRHILTDKEDQTGR